MLPTPLAHIEIMDSCHAQHGEGKAYAEPSQSHKYIKHEAGGIW